MKTDSSEFSDHHESEVNHSPESPAMSADDSVNGSIPANTPSTPRRAFKPKSLWPIAILAMIAVLAGVGLRAYQSLEQESGSIEQETDSPARLPVRVAQAEVGLSQKWVFDEGSVRAVRQRILNFQTDGDVRFVAKVNGRDLRAGDQVRAGQLLARIDDRKERSSIDTTKADLEVAIQQRNQAEASLLQAKADFDKAQSDVTFAKAELKRYQNLFAKGAVSASTRDTYVNSEEQAQAALRVAAQGIRSSEDGVRSARASINASRARLRQSGVDLEDTQLVSPINGVVAYINIREGEYWSAQRFNSNLAQDVVETAPIVIVNPQSFEVELELQADEARQIQPGQAAYVVLEEDLSAAEATGATNSNLLNIAQQQGSRGQVFSVSPTQTPSGRGVRVSIRDFQTRRNLQVGGRVYVWISAAVNPNAVMIPLGAVLRGEQESYAFVVDKSSGAVERRRIELGIESMSGVEIRSGITPGELVVTDGINRLVNGTLVEIVSKGTIR
ncbi:MAG: multidrug transporter [Cyanobacteria bacterium P01_F01_bin.42]